MTQAKVSGDGYLLKGVKNSSSRTPPTPASSSAPHSLMTTKSPSSSSTPPSPASPSAPSPASYPTPPKSPSTTSNFPESALMPGGWKSLDWTAAILKVPPRPRQPTRSALASSVFEMTLDYSNTRVQFGLPIGRFPARPGPRHPNREPQGRRPLDHLRSPLEARRKQV